MPEPDATPVEGEVIAPVVDTELLVIMSKDHPHYSEAGWLVRDEPRQSTGQYYFKLSNCQHGLAGCYVLEEELVAIDTMPETIENQTNRTVEFDPYKYSTATEERLVQAFEKSFNVSEACQYAGISRDTFYQWLKSIEGFEARMEEAKAAPLKQAKSVIHMALQANDVATAKWYTERRDPDFKSKAEVDNNIGLQETRKKLGDLLDERSADDFGEQPASTVEPASGNEVPENPTDIS